MLNEQNDINYSGSDLQRYNSGAMSPAEMHALEKAAMNDPFLADALDGYAYTSNAEQDLAAIQKNISSQKAEKRMFFFGGRSRSALLRIAAVVIVFLGVALLYFQINQPTSKKELADNTAKPVYPAAANDTSVNAEKLTASTAQDTLSTLTPTNTQVDTDRSGANEARKEQEERLVSLEAKQNVLRQQSAKVAYDDADKNYYKMQGRIVDDKGAAVPFATVHAKEQNIPVQADANGKFSIQSKDSILLATVDAPGYQSRDIQLQKSKVQTVQIEPADATMSEVVVTGYGNARKKTTSAAVTTVLPGKVAADKNIIVADSAAPVSGWLSYNQYLADSNRIANSGNPTRARGQVSLSFRIDKTGRPVKIKTAASLSPEADKEAIRLLTSGASWKGYRKRRVAFTIPFN